MEERILKISQSTVRDMIASHTPKQKWELFIKDQFPPNNKPLLDHEAVGLFRFFTLSPAFLYFRIKDETVIREPGVVLTRNFTMGDDLSQFINPERAVLYGIFHVEANVMKIRYASVEHDIYSC